jgi:hypothetical protein
MKIARRFDSFFPSQLLKEKNIMENSSDSINAEYARVCALLGDKEFRLKLLKDEIEELHKNLISLNNAMKSLKTPD